MNDVISTFGSWLWNVLRSIPFEFVACVGRIDMAMLVCCACGYLVVELYVRGFLKQTRPFQIMSVFAGVLAALFIPIPQMQSIPGGLRNILLLFVLGLFAVLPQFTATFMVRRLGYQRLAILCMYAAGLMLILIQAIILIFR